MEKVAEEFVQNCVIQGNMKEERRDYWREGEKKQGGKEKNNKKTTR